MQRATWNDAVIAESNDTAVVDGYTYFPEADVHFAHLRESDRTSTCYWKGEARYYDVIVDGEVNPAAAWYYPDPSPEATEAGVKGRIGFWRGVQIEADAPTEAQAR